MSIYGHKLMFGTFLEVPGGDLRDVVHLAQLTEQVGLDVVSLSDRPYRPDRLDILNASAVVVALTTAIRVVSNLADLPPARLARTAAMLGNLSNGRFEVGLGTGARDFTVTNGSPRPNASESAEALNEAVSIVRQLWNSESTVTFEGRHYRLVEVEPGPPPEHDMGMWVGADQPPMLHVAGSIGDAWIPSPSFAQSEQLRAANRLIDGAAINAGRSPRDIRRVYPIPVYDNGFQRGRPEVSAERLAELAIQDGMSVFLLHRAASADAIRWFANEIVPAVREIVDAAANSGHI